MMQHGEQKRCQKGDLMNIHLVTLIGSHVKQLPYMLDHYRKMGIESFIINVHVERQDDPVLSEVRQTVGDFGHEIASVTVGKWSFAIHQGVYHQSRSGGEDDWFLIADLDEFQIYPGNLFNIIEECEREGYEYIRGCFIDRIAADGSFPELRLDMPIEDQFPLGSIFTYHILGGLPLKVVAAKRHIMLGPGNHYPMNGVGCPITDCFVQVHHYKWIREIVERLKHLANREFEIPKYTLECRKFVEYYQANDGRIDIDDPGLLVSECKPEYKYWERIKEAALAHIPSERPGLL
jgi:hypothetical protein